MIGSVLAVRSGMVQAAWVGVAIFALAFALGVWAIVTIRSEAQVKTYKPTTAIVANDFSCFTRNPIYLNAQCRL